MSKYDVNPQKAANILAEMRKHFDVPEGTPVRYAKQGTEKIMKEGAFKNAVQLDPARCAEAQQCLEDGIPTLVMRREAACLEPTRNGKSKVITLYAKSAGLTDRFDATGEFVSFRFQFLAWPKSWFPEYRAKLAQDRVTLIRSGGEVKKRNYSRRAAKPNTPMRVTSFA